MIYATIWLLGISVGAIGIPENATMTCKDMLVMMVADTEAAFADHRYGLAIGDGAITRKGDWSHSCETIAPEVWDARPGSDPRATYGQETTWPSTSPKTGLRCATGCRQGLERRCELSPT